MKGKPKTQKVRVPPNNKMNLLKVRIFYICVTYLRFTFYIDFITPIGVI